MADTVKKDGEWVTKMDLQLTALAGVEEQFSKFAHALKMRHDELRAQTPAIDEAVESVRLVVADAADKTRQAADDIKATVAKLSVDAPGDFADWRRETASVKSVLEGVVADVSANLEETKNSLAGIRQALTAFREGGGFLSGKVDEIKKAIDLNTHAKVGDAESVLPHLAPPPTVDLKPVLEELDRKTVAQAMQLDAIRAELVKVGTLKTEFDQLEKSQSEMKMILAAIEGRNEELTQAIKLLANKVTVPSTLQPPADATRVSSKDVAELRTELAEMKLAFFELLHYVKKQAEKEIPAPQVTIPVPQGPDPAKVEAVAKQMADGYHNLVKLLAEKKS